MSKLDDDIANRHFFLRDNDLGEFGDTLLKTKKLGSRNVGPIKIDVPYEERRLAGKLGAIWNGDYWYIPDNTFDFRRKFARWLEPEVYRVYLNVPYAGRTQAQRLGAYRDKQRKQWFVYKDNPNLEACKRWM
jgi:hypothetical protein